MKGICIHETMWPTMVYPFRRYGCIRVMPQNIVRISYDVEPRAQEELVYVPVKVTATAEGKILFEGDHDVSGKAGNMMAEVTRPTHEQILHPPR
jgi:hypothetical protein